MNSIKLLDVSLRDGGHRTNFHFKDDELEEILTHLDDSGLEYIEIGYRNGSLHPVENLGRAGLCARDYLLFCQARVRKAKMAVMVHPENVNKADLEELKECGVGLLRICISKGEAPKALATIALAREAGMEVSANFIHLSYYKDEELDKVVALISEAEPDIIYFADSNGSLLPDKIKAIYERYQYSSIPFGFHAHDNLGLAQANALAALKAGAHYIDTSLAGMGKGIGNLKTEFFTAYLQALNIRRYNLSPILDAANYVRKALGIGQEAIEMDEFVRGISDFSTADLKAFKLEQRETTLNEGS